MSYPAPRIGYWVSECCQEDLYQILTQEQLNDALERIEDNDEFGELMVFSTENEARDRLQRAMTRSPLQVLAEYCGYPEGSENIPCVDVLLCRALDKLAADGEYPNLFTLYKPLKWCCETRVAFGATVFRREVADTRLEAVAALVEKIRG